MHRHEQTVAADTQEAALHRRMASKLDENHAASGTQSPAMRVNRSQRMDRTGFQ
jgi:hypothetical protein